MAHNLIYYKPPKTFHEVCVDFNGSNEKMGNRGGGSGNAMGFGGKFAVSAWIKTDSVTGGGFHTILRIEDPIGTDFEMALTHENASVRVEVNNGLNFRIINFASTLSANVWIHLFFTVDMAVAADVVLYKDSVLKTPSTLLDFTASLSDVDRTVFIGGNEQDTQWFNGRIYSVAIWDTDAWVQSGVDQIYNSGDGRFDLSTNLLNYVRAANLQHWWQLGRDDTDIGKDSGNGSPLIDVDDDSANITTADIIEDFPS